MSIYVVVNISPSEILKIMKIYNIKLSPAKMDDLIAFVEGWAAYEAQEIVRDYIAQLDERQINIILSYDGG